MFAEHLFSTMVTIVGYQLVGVALFLPVELAFPKARMTLAERMHGLIFLVTAAPFAALFGAAVKTAQVAAGIEPLISFNSTLGTPIIASIALAIWVDLHFYIVHRLEHRFLWRFHAVHHSIRNLSAPNSYHHWTEGLWIALFITVPLMFVNVQIEPTLGLLSALFLYWQFYIHSGTRLHLGPLRWLLVDNRYHRIHHSVEPRHHGKNFAAFFAPLDWIGGTQHMPQADEWPDVGLSDQPEPQGLRDWFLAPWSDGHPASPARRSQSEEMLATPPSPIRARQ